MKYCLIFSREIFYVTIVFCLNILWLKAVNEITARQTRISLRKHDVIKVSSIEYFNHTNRISVAIFQVRTVHKIIEYLTLGLLSSLWNHHSTTTYFFDQPCILNRSSTVTVASWFSVQPDAFCYKDLWKLKILCRNCVICINYHDLNSYCVVSFTKSFKTSKHQPSFM